MNNIFLTLFLVMVMVMLFLDLVVLHRKDHVVTIKEALLQTCIWVCLALGFAVLLFFHAEWTLSEETLATITDLDDYRREAAEQFLAGYFIEESLSIDNIFVMIMIFESFGIAKEYYHRVLFWGIFGAIVLRFIFIFALGALVTRFDWLLAIFGVILLYSGTKMFAKKSNEQIDTANHPIVRFASKHFNVTTTCYGHDFFHRENSKFMLTPLFLVLIVIEFSDIIFAVDSIPAVFSVSTNSLIVYTSNIFAIMGLRSLFFLLADISDRFWTLHYGLGVLLLFIGIKRIGGVLFDLHIGTLVSLGVIIGILVVSILLSFLLPQPKKTK